MRPTDDGTQDAVDLLAAALQGLREQMDDEIQQGQAKITALEAQLVALQSDLRYVQREEAGQTEAAGTLVAWGVVLLGFVLAVALGWFLRGGWGV